MYKYFLVFLCFPLFLKAEIHDAVTDSKSETNAQQSPSIPDHEIALTNAIRELLRTKGITMSGEYTPQLCAITRTQNKVMIEDRVFSHEPQNFNMRAKVSKAVSAGGRYYAENIAMNGFGGTLEQRAAMCAQQWWNSAGHRNNMVKKHDNYCHSMQMVGNKTWCTSGYSSKIKVGPEVPTPTQQENSSEQNAPPSPLLVVGTEPKEGEVNPFPQLRLDKQANQVHGKTVDGKTVPIHFNAAGIPIGGARGEYTLSNETIDDLYHYYKSRPVTHSRPLVSKFMNWASKPTQKTEPWPAWKCEDAPEAKGLSPITKSSFEIQMFEGEENTGSCTANLVSKQKLSDGKCEFGMASAAHCMIPKEHMDKKNYSKNILTKIKTRFGDIPINGNLDFPEDYRGMEHVAAKSDVALVRFRSSCDTAEDSTILKIADTMPVQGATFSLAKRDESHTHGTIKYSEDSYGDVNGYLSGPIGERGDSGGAIISNGEFVGVLGRSIWIQSGPGITQRDTFFRDVRFFRQGNEWIKRTLASCYGGETSQSRIKPREVNNQNATNQTPSQNAPTPKPDAKKSETAQATPLASDIEWRTDGMWGKDVNGNTVPLVIHNTTGELLGGEKGEHQVSNNAKQQLYDYVNKYPERFTAAEKAHFKPFLDNWSKKLKGVKTEIKPAQLKPEEQKQNTKDNTPPGDKILEPQRSQSTNTAFSDPLSQLDCKKTPVSTKYSESRYGSVLADIFNHAIAEKGYQPIHLSGDPVTQAHETTHGINSVMRNKPEYLFSRPTGPGITSGFGNSFYIERGCSVVMPEPYKTRKSWVLQSVPKSLQFSRKDTYIRGQLSFEDRPLNLMDEFSAYINGSRTAVDQNKRGIWRDLGRDSITGAVEFIPMALGLGMTFAKHEPEYFKQSPQFLNLLKVQIERAVTVYNDASKIPGMLKQTESTVLNNLKNAADAEPMRVWVKKTYGEEWAKTVLGI